MLCFVLHFWLFLQKEIRTLSRISARALNRIITVIVLTHRLLVGSAHLTVLGQFQKTISDSPAKIVVWILNGWNIKGIDGIHGTVYNCQGMKI